MEHTRSADEWRTDLRRRLVSAMKGRDSIAMAALRSMIGAIDNAEAADAEAAPAVEAGVIAGGVTGAGAGEVARRDLTSSDLVAILRNEATERRTDGAGYRDVGQSDAAASLEAEAAVIEGVLRDCDTG